ncbi:hypothetical protein [Bordetella genomosp. 13]|uniref:hypothetical protein n=1 Tax=Bordetella genomosp. 13 TaxID=463040 RepID=UPI0021B50522|nr:hypothetical protein [Bordetella genomosp. 13]
MPQRVFLTPDAYAPYPRRLQALVLSALLATALLHGPASAQPLPQDPYLEHLPPPPRAAPKWRRVDLGPAGKRYPFPIYASIRLDQPKALRNVRRVVIVIHDDRRDAARALESATGLYAGNRERAADTLVLAPKFPSAVEAGFNGLPAWRRGDWKDGQPSGTQRGRPGPVGAFQVLDDLLRDLSAQGRLPLLHEIVLAGHGSGGQMVQRYAVLNGIDESLRASGLALSYVVSNADSYLYLTPDRLRPDGRGFARYERGICPTYDQYRYGLDSLPPALGKPDRVRLAARYAARSVTYLFGGADNNPEQPGLDKTCGAEAQGATRLSRGLNYWRYDTRGDQRVAPLTHRAFEVGNAGHGDADLYGSSCGVQALMGAGAVTQANAPACIALKGVEPRRAAPR